jgi:hypothetical protein
MTYLTNCQNCGSDVFCYTQEVRDYVTLHNEGGIVPLSDEQSKQLDLEASYFGLVADRPEQVRCLGCGLSVERERLDPGFDWDSDEPTFKIQVRK